MAEFVLVHGSTQSPAGWDRLAGALGARGHAVTAIDLPTDRPGWTVADYAREAAGQAGESAGRWLGVNPVSDQQQALRFLFHDCDPATQRWALGTLRLFNPGPAVYQHKPEPLPSGITRAVIVPAGDRTLRPGWMRQAARERLATESADVGAGHCPHVSQPEAIAGILAQV